ncbi:hypothetical protein L596_017299 [Steinernema carpocapsae]|uniref:Ig-like domain-containing protein n=1 Tax=Steinernema carpocapsae TaxID=34508 RepID=A0A4U5N1L2_STECR|nr:hypothetical protein L596_017299 [Steinernema carpocapsae]
MLVLGHWLIFLMFSDCLASWVDPSLSRSSAPLTVVIFLSQKLIPFSAVLSLSWFKEDNHGYVLCNKEPSQLQQARANRNIGFTL